MDSMADCKDKLSYFRIKELKDVLTKLGQSKQGRKQDLIERILSAVSDDPGLGMARNGMGKDEVAKLVDDTYRKMQSSGATELASKSQGLSETSNVKLKEEVADSYQAEKIRCTCGSTLPHDSMIKCEDSRCGVWQHITCVIIPEKPKEGAPPIPDTFYCEICRLARADPFWVTVANPLYPVKLVTTSVPADGSNPLQSVEKTFQLTRTDKELLSKQEFDVQAWCMLLNDKVPFRMQWPQYADLQVNGVPLRAVNRPGSQLLGANGRDDGTIITPCTRDGINKISLTGCDARIFCLGVRLVKRRTVQQILNLIPKESEGEQFEEALARVRRCVGGGTPTENADSDSDLEVVADFIPVNLRCPMSGSRMKVAGRFKPCAHMGCFDLEVFVEMNQRSRKWQCPVCLKNYALEHAIIDPYFNGITSKLRNCSEDVTEVEVKPDGSWRAKTEGDAKSLGDLRLWHAPDGSLCAPMDIESKPIPDEVKQVKQEGGSDFHAGLKLGMKKNRNGIWEISKHGDMQTYSSGNKIGNGFYNLKNLIPMSSSATGSDRDGEATSVNQDCSGTGNLDHSANNGTELESLSLNMHRGYQYSEPAPLPDTEVIVLSDSDEENEPLNSSGIVYQNHRQTNDIVVPYQEAPPVVPDSYQEDTTFTTDGNTFPTFINGNDDELMHMWSLLPSSSQGGPGFQLFGSEGDGTDSLVDMQQPDSVICPPIIGHILDGGESAMGPAALLPDSSVEHPHDDGFVVDPLAFGGNNPSLELFLSSRPTDAPVQADLGDDLLLSNDFPDEDCLELRLGGSGGGESTSVNGLNSREKMQSNDGPVNSLANAASLHLGMNDNTRTTKSSRERSESDSPFIFPRQKRSVRPRLYLSIDSESGSDSE